jgi:hypothetical protein
MKNLRPLNLVGNKLNVTGANEHGKILLTQHKDYIQKKVVDAFGKKLNIQFSEDINLRDEESQSKTVEKPTPKTKNPNNSLIDAIINELGGQEI